MLTDAAGLAQLNRDAGTVPVLVHPQPRGVLGEIAATVYGRPSEHLAVVGVTGTSGKTTTTYLIEAGLRSAGRSVGLIGTVGLRINGEDIPSALTTPEAPALQALLAAMAERGVDTVVMEVSSHALTLGRVDGIRFAVGGFTNLSRDHLDFHPTMEDYFEAKARLFDPASPLRARRAVVCVDDEAGRAMAHRADKAVTVSTKGRPRRLARRGRHRAGRRARSSPRSTRPVSTIGWASRCPATTTSPIALSHWRFWTPSGSPRSRRQPGCGTPRFPGDSSRSTAARTSSRWSTTRTSRARCTRCCGRCGARTADWRWCSAPVVIAIRASGREMGRVAAELADLVVVTDDNPRSEDPAAIRREILSGAAEAGADSRRGRDRGPARGDRPRRGVGGAPATSC